MSVWKSEELDEASTCARRLRKRRRSAPGRLRKSYSAYTHLVSCMNNSESDSCHFLVDARTQAVS